ncbi:MAG: extracellular solute-binding protein, partial [Chloroflexota bacterium]
MVRSMRVSAFVASALLVASVAMAGSVVGQSDTTITVRSLWGGSEQEAFQKVLDAFEAETGIKAEYESVRQDYASVLRTDVAGGNPPDVAIIPNIGFVRS